MASKEIEEILVRCPSPDSGCFASDPDALSSLLYFDDAVVRANLGNITNAAIEAGIKGSPVEQITYFPVTIEEVGYNPNTGMNEVELAEGFSANSVFVETTDGIDLLQQRIARCAYACGAAALTCPVVVIPEN